MPTYNLLSFDSPDALARAAALSIVLPRAAHQHQRAGPQTIGAVHDDLHSRLHAAVQNRQLALRQGDLHRGLC